MAASTGLEPMTLAQQFASSIACIDRLLKDSIACHSWPTPQ